MKKLLIIIISFFFVGCATINQQTDPETGYRQTTFNDPSAVGMSQSASIIEKCLQVDEQGKGSNCKPVSLNHTSSNGWFLQMFEPAAIAGGMVGMGAVWPEDSTIINQNGAPVTQNPCVGNCAPKPKDKPKKKKKK